MDHAVVEHTGYSKSGRVEDLRPEVCRAIFPCNSVSIMSRCINGLCLLSSCRDNNSQKPDTLCFLRSVFFLTFRQSSMRKSKNE